eukprot:gnl/TRDRNA2_/TRDRNA2_173642_c1_seq2.p1 gnl/TRDRNA2_/TRDRNA2_173642_c1~~gnl/TRDRNA2_/TRDRNA2_173642_c1_seq2.p1  ORF type:complete len:929 (-),score=154.50 gnl/TRDRNA2_/TRDRNA2_173642_c1_seq2:41-2827(-)
MRCPEYAQGLPRQLLVQQHAASAPISAVRQSSVTPLMRQSSQPAAGCAPQGSSAAARWTWQPQGRSHSPLRPRAPVADQQAKPAPVRPPAAQGAQRPQVRGAQRSCSPVRIRSLLPTPEAPTEPSQARSLVPPQESAVRIRSLLPVPPKEAPTEPVQSRSLVPPPIVANVSPPAQFHGIGSASFPSSENPISRSRSLSPTGGAACSIKSVAASGDVGNQMPLTAPDSAAARNPGQQGPPVAPAQVPPAPSPSQSPVPAQRFRAVFRQPAVGSFAPVGNPSPTPAAGTARTGSTGARPRLVGGPPWTWQASAAVEAHAVPEPVAGSMQRQCSPADEVRPVPTARRLLRNPAEVDAELTRLGGGSRSVLRQGVTGIRDKVAGAVECRPIQACLIGAGPKPAPPQPVGPVEECGVHDLATTLLASVAIPAWPSREDACCGAQLRKPPPSQLPSNGQYAVEATGGREALLTAPLHHQPILSQRLPRLAQPHLVGSVSEPRLQTMPDQFSDFVHVDEQPQSDSTPPADAQAGIPLTGRAALQDILNTPSLAETPRDKKTPVVPTGPCQESRPGLRMQESEAIQDCPLVTERMSSLREHPETDYSPHAGSSSASSSGSLSPAPREDPIDTEASCMEGFQDAESHPCPPQTPLRMPAEGSALAAGASPSLPSVSPVSNSSDGSSEFRFGMSPLQLKQPAPPLDIQSPSMQSLPSLPSLRLSDASDSDPTGGGGHEINTDQHSSKEPPALQSELAKHSHVHSLEESITSLPRPLCSIRSVDHCVTPPPSPRNCASRPDNHDGDVLSHIDASQSQEQSNCHKCLQTPPESPSRVASAAASLVGCLAGPLKRLSGGKDRRRLSDKRTQSPKSAEAADEAAADTATASTQECGENTSSKPAEVDLDVGKTSAASAGEEEEVEVPTEEEQDDEEEEEEKD